MTISIPESALAEGSVKAVFVPTAATDSAALINAGVDISCFLMPDWDGPTPTQNTGESRRFCSRESFQRLGRTTWAIPALSYTYLPQQLGTPGHAANAVYEALAAGNEGILYIGYGIEPSDDFAATDVVDRFPVECGTQGKPARGADEFAPLTVTQTLAVIGPVDQDVVLAA